MKLHHLRDVVVVAQRGSLRQAARHLGMTQPSLTRSIRELEHELDVTLFERNGTGMTLTAAGRAVLARAQGIESEVRRIRDDIDHIRGVATGSISIGLSTVSHLALLPRVLARFTARYPGVRLRIVEGLFPALENEVRLGTIDFYIGPIGEEANPAHLGVEPLFRNVRMIFARCGHPLGAAGSLADLADAGWVTGALTLVSEDELSPIFATFGLPRPRVVVDGRTSLTMIAVAAASDLMTMLPRQWVAPLEASGMLRTIPIAEQLEAPTICMVRRTSLPLTPVAEDLSDMFRRAAIAYGRTMPDLDVLTA